MEHPLAMDAEAMRRSGLTHLLSVSGLHIAAAVGFAMLLSLRLLALSEPDRCVLIDANAPSSAVAERVWKIVSERLDPATAPVAVGDVAS